LVVLSSQTVLEIRERRKAHAVPSLPHLVSAGSNADLNAVASTGAGQYSRREIVIKIISLIGKHPINFFLLSMDSVLSVLIWVIFLLFSLPPTVFAFAVVCVSEAHFAASDSTSQVDPFFANISYSYRYGFALGLTACLLAFVATLLTGAWFYIVGGALSLCCGKISASQSD
jgi:uncharacterized membrane protein